MLSAKEFRFATEEDLQAVALSLAFGPLQQFLQLQHMLDILRGIPF